MDRRAEFLNSPVRTEKLELFEKFAAGAGDVDSARHAAFAVLGAFNDASLLAAFWAVSRLGSIHHFFTVSGFCNFSHGDFLGSARFREHGTKCRGTNLYEVGCGKIIAGIPSHPILHESCGYVAAAVGSVGVNLAKLSPPASHPM